MVHVDFLRFIAVASRKSMRFIYFGPRTFWAKSAELYLAERKYGRYKLLFRTDVSGTISELSLGLIMSMRSIATYSSCVSKFSHYHYRPTLKKTNGQHPSHFFCN